ncbi:MAG: hypothetical protein ACLS7Z_08830 [Christensenellales bacterium]
MRKRLLRFLGLPEDSTGTARDRGQSTASWKAAGVIGLTESRVREDGPRVLSVLGEGLRLRGVRRCGTD